MLRARVRSSLVSSRFACSCACVKSCLFLNTNSTSAVCLCHRSPSLSLCHLMKAFWTIATVSRRPSPTRHDRWWKPDVSSHDGESQSGTVAPRLTVIDSRRAPVRRSPACTQTSVMIKINTAPARNAGVGSAACPPCVPICIPALTNGHQHSASLGVELEREEFIREVTK